MESLCHFGGEVNETAEKVRTRNSYRTAQKEVVEFVISEVDKLSMVATTDTYRT